MVVCDGMITGAGETRTTPDIVVGMMDLDPTMREPKQSSYVAIADGERQLNMAKVVRAVGDQKRVTRYASTKAIHVIGFLVCWTLQRSSLYCGGQMWHRGRSEQTQGWQSWKA